MSRTIAQYHAQYGSCNNLACSCHNSCNCSLVFFGCCACFNNLRPALIDLVILFSSFSVGCNYITTKFSSKATLKANAALSQSQLIALWINLLADCCSCGVKRIPSCVAALMVRTRSSQFLLISFLGFTFCSSCNNKTPDCLMSYRCFPYLLITLYQLGFCVSTTFFYKILTFLYYRVFLH